MTKPYPVKPVLWSCLILVLSFPWSTPKFSTSPDLKMGLSSHILPVHSQASCALGVGRPRPPWASLRRSGGNSTPTVSIEIASLGQFLQGKILQPPSWGTQAWLPVLHMPGEERTWPLKGGRWRARPLSSTGGSESPHPSATNWTQPDWGHQAQLRRGCCTETKG